jgi:hypothetical protein
MMNQEIRKSGRGLEHDFIGAGELSAEAFNR